MGLDRVLVHLHLYRSKQFNNLARYIKNILSSTQCSVTIFVTITENIKDIQSNVLDCFPNAKILIVANNGYDIGPFFQVLKLIDLDDFDYLIKIHSKDTRFGIICRIGDRLISRRVWKNLLLDSISPSTSLFEKNLNEFKKDPNLGMIGSSYLILRGFDKYDYNSLDESLVQRLKIQKNPDFGFVCGTMFIARASLFKYLSSYGCLNDEFDKTIPGVKGGTLAHAYEKSLGWMIEQQGYSIKGFDQSLFNDFFTSKIIGKIKHFFFNKRVTSQGRLLIRVCLIPVCNLKIK